MTPPNPAHAARAASILKRAFHEATFMRGQTTPAAKHLFDAIHVALKLIHNAPIEARETDKAQ